MIPSFRLSYIEKAFEDWRSRHQLVPTFLSMRCAVHGTERSFPSRPFASRKDASPMSVERCTSLVVRLHEIEAIKFGSFTLKSGLISPLYLDLRVIVSYPDVLADVADVMWDAVGDASSRELLCGVPYTALPIATALSLKHGVPMLMRRKEVKDYGTKKAIEGVYRDGQEVLIVEDLVTSGSSVMETVEPLQAEGLNVRHTVVLIDREQGGKQNLRERGITLHAAFGMGFLLEVLTQQKLISDEMASAVREFLKSNSVTAIPSTVPSKSIPRISYRQRAKLSKNAMARRCFETMERKQSNLAVAADVTRAQALLELADALGPHISILKTHVDILEDWTPDISQRLMSLAQKHDFLIFEDRKFADIGNTVVQQYVGGIYKIADWADVTNAHLVSGPDIIDGLWKAHEGRERGILLLAEMSSKGTLATGGYTQSVVEAALKRQEMVMGFISVNPSLWTDVRSRDGFLGMVQMTPGVKLNEKTDALGQQYNTPEAVIQERGSDVIIVGRGIIQAKDPVASAIKYKQEGWQAYLSSLQEEQDQ